LSPFVRAARLAQTLKDQAEDLNGLNGEAFHKKK
jgi:streptomycin 6-kinase